MNFCTRILTAVLIISGVFVFSAGASRAENPFSFSHIDAEQLERQMWAYLKANDTQDFQARLALGFQSIHFDGSRDRDGEIELAQNLRIASYELSDFKISYETGLVVVTYLAKVFGENIKGEALSSKAAPRMSVWIKTAGGWKWLMHANLNQPNK